MDWTDRHSGTDAAVDEACAGRVVAWTPDPRRLPSGVATRPMELRMDDDVKNVARIAMEATARAMALEVLVTRLLASHAQMFPEGIGARLIDNPTVITENVTGALPESWAEMAPLIEAYLRGYLDRAGRLHDGLT